MGPELSKQKLIAFISQSDSLLSFSSKPDLYLFPSNLSNTIIYNLS